MDYLPLTEAVQKPTDSRDDLLIGLLNREAIRNLISLYSVLRDDDDIEALLNLFTPDGRFDAEGQVFEGRDQLLKFYADNMSKYRVSVHSTHTALITIDGIQGSGLVAGHAELAYAGTLMVAAYRYDDRYECLEEGWRFASRILRFVYVVPADQLATSFVDQQRIRWPDSEPAKATIPESLPGWRRQWRL